MRSRGGRGGAPSLVALAAVLAGSAAPAQAFLPFGSNSGATKPEPAAGGGCAGMGAGVDMRAAVRAHVPGKDKALMDRSPGKDNGDPLKLYNFKSCAVVGNGGILSANAHGKAIDSHTAVFRANQAPTRGYESKTGRNTQFRVLNKTWLAKYSSGIGWLPKEPNVGLVTSRGASGLVTKLYQKHRGNRRVRVYTMHSAVGSGSRKLLQEFRRRLQCSKKKRRLAGGNTPSSGIFMVVMAMALCDGVTVYGFGNGGKAYQYYKFHSTERKVGDKVHSFDAEKALIEQLGKEGHIKTCFTKGNPSCGLQN